MSVLTATQPANIRETPCDSALSPHASAWEFWPAWVVYTPLLPYLAWLSLRYGGPTVFTAANPALPHGGVVGESKFSILSQLKGPNVLPSLLLTGDTYEHHLKSLDAWMKQSDASFPLIFKPDVGERGAGVRLVHSMESAQHYLSTHAAPTVVQRFHAGPFEAGIFYIRPPGNRCGRIFSITDKVFPRVRGDGSRSLHDLILAHPRYALQSAVFLKRLGTLAHRIPDHGEIVPLAMAGNHCQGTMFRDGSHLASSALASALDDAIKEFDGFCFGRFDVRYTSPEALMRGEEFGIVELNGVLSESTNIYDPRSSFWNGQRVLRRQWKEAFAIGHANVRRGAKASGLIHLLSAIVTHLHRDHVDQTSD